MELKYKKNIYDVETKMQEQNWLLKINNENIPFNAKVISDNNVKFNHKEQSLTAFTADTQNYFYVNINGENFTFEKISEEEKNYDSENSTNKDQDLIKPPMPGSIVKIFVETGQKVKEGDSLIIVEAMKMETTLFSSIDGIISQINVKEKEQVDSDKVLIVVDKEV
jgi:biotin carboxyl carrier protein